MPDPTQPMNEEELKQCVLESFWNIAHISQATAPDGGDEWIVTKKDFNAYADRVTEMFFGDRNAAIREARIDELSHITVTELDDELGAWYEPDEGYQMTISKRIELLQSQPNTKEDSDVAI